MPVPPALLDSLDLVHAIRERQERRGKERSHGLWPCSGMTAWRYVRAVMEQAGLSGAEASAKGLRHGFGVAAVSAGISPNLVQKWLGHANVTTTAIYANALALRTRILPRGFGVERTNMSGILIDDAEADRTAAAWIASCRAEKPGQNEHFWAFELLFDYCMDEPEKAWVFLKKLVFLDNTDADISRIAAGPAENLLVYHGPAVIDPFEHLARIEPKFRNLLGGVWKRNIADEVWLRIQAVSGPKW